MPVVFLSLAAIPGRAALAGSANLGLVLAADPDQAALGAVAILDRDAAERESAARLLAAVGSEAQSRREVLVALGQAVQEA